MNHDLYLTFDIDWVADEVIQFTADLLADLQVSEATFFATHATPMLDLLRDRGFELGIRFIKMDEQERQLLNEAIEKALPARAKERHGRSWWRSI